MAESEEGSKSKPWIIAFVVILAMVVCVVAIFFLFRKTETRETSTKDNYAITALTCKASSPENAFFSSSAAISNEHTIKITFKDESADKISYNYEGKLEDNEKAESLISSFHADYNIYMSDNGLNPEILSPSFVATNNAARINLYSTVSSLNGAIPKIFFLTSGDRNKITTYSEKTIQKIYENVGFKCEYND